MPRTMIVSVLLLVMMSALFSIFATANKHKPEKPGMIQLCFDNTDRYFTQEDYR